MQVSELLKLTNWFDEHFIETGVSQKFAALHSILNNNSSARRNHNQQFQSFDAQKEDLLNAIGVINFKSLSLEQIKFLEQLNIVGLVGSSGIGIIEEILFKNSLDITTATIKIGELNTTMSAAQRTIQEIKTTLSKSFSLDEHDEIPEDSVLMRIYFQQEVSIQNLADFKKLSATWYDIGRGIAMAQNKSPEDFEIIGAQKGSVILELAVAAGIATTVSKILLEGLKVADRVLDILKKAQELKKMKLSNKKIEQELEKEAQLEKEKGVSSILNSAVDSLKLDKTNQGDKVEALEKSIKKLIDFTQKGGLVDFVQKDQDDTDEEGNSEVRNELKSLNSNISEIRLLESKNYDQKEGSEK
ncbi:MAG: hypothetical protein R8G66_18135 [Cytophagales bacterium]|nr:hypothetical protein [Cytophagales bacterium]